MLLQYMLVFKNSNSDLLNFYIKLTTWMRTKGLLNSTTIIDATSLLNLRTVSLLSSLLESKYLSLKR